jgi:ABC-type uncharacterized transport system involved in gliding motility auxiliary subunit
MILEYQGRTEHVQNFTEEDFTNTLQRLLRNAERQIVFVTGHGERDPLANANHDLGMFFDGLKNKGFKVSTLNLTTTLAIPANTAVLVIASPLIEYLPGEIDTIKKFVADGGNLWWMQEPDSKSKLTALADALHVKFLDGIIVDLDIRLLGVTDPTIIMGQYQPHAITKDFNVLTLYPRVAGLDYEARDNWTITPFLQSIERSWLEKGPLQNTIRFDEGVDIQGPIKVGLALNRELKPAEAADKDKKTAEDTSKEKPKTQRVVVMGDGDFISNAFLGNQGNQAMGENIINWLTHDDSFIDIPPATAPDAKLAVEQNTMIMLGFLYLLVIPLLLIGSGVFIWLRRRKR